MVDFRHCAPPTPRSHPCRPRLLSQHAPSPDRCSPPQTGEEVIDIKCYSDPAPNPEATPTSLESVLRVEDFGGCCVFDHQSVLYDLDGTIEGQIVFSDMHDAPAIGEVSVVPSLPFL